MSTDQEDYESGLEGVDTRPNLNTSGKHATYQIEWKKMEEDKTKCGRLRYWFWSFWCFLFRIQYLFTDFIIVMATAGTYYGATKAGMDEDLAFMRSILAGLVTMLVLRGLNYMSYRCAMFPEKSTVHVEDELHYSKYLVFLVHIIFFSVGVSLIARLNEFCAKDTKPCLVEQVFNPTVFSKKWP